MLDPTPRLIDRALLAERPLPRPDPAAGKAGRGKLLLVAGSLGLPGAAILAARAALRVGCGTVRVATARSVAAAIGVAVPELMVVPLPETDEGTIAAEGALERLEPHWGAASAAVIGPGLGRDPATDRFVVRFLAECRLPLVVDAGALLAWGEAGRPKAGAAWVLTPHAQEMASITGLEPERIRSEREAIAARSAEEWGAVVVLKGDETVVAGDGRYLNRAGSDGLGTAGSGDVLAGVIGGLLARGAEPTRAAVWGVHLHALAGEAAARRLGDDGMMATDVVEGLPEAMRACRPGG